MNALNFPAIPPRGDIFQIGMGGSQNQKVENDGGGGSRVGPMSAREYLLLAVRKHSHPSVRVRYERRNVEQRCEHLAQKKGGRGYPGPVWDPGFPKEPS